MAQVKKPKLRQAILTASFSLFSKNGYHNTTISNIAKQAKLSTANVYSYFPSKLHILYALYEPWLSSRLDEMELETTSLLDSQLRDAVQAATAAFITGQRPLSDWDAYVAEMEGLGATQLVDTYNAALARQ